jgi:hypothetical protein
MQKLRARFADSAPAKLADESFEIADRYLGRLLVFRKGSYIGGWSITGEGLDGTALSRALAASLP